MAAPSLDHASIFTEQEAFSRFRRALRRSDQIALDDLFAAARNHCGGRLCLARLAFEVLLLAMLLEEHKEVMRLRESWLR